MRKFRFTDSSGQDLPVNIPEKVDPAYGMYVWPCAPVLAQYIWHNRKHLLVGKHVLEIGAGTSLPGIVAAKCGSIASLTLTDDLRQPRCLENCIQSCSASSLPCQLINDDYNPTDSACSVPSIPPVFVMGLTWGEISPSVLKMCSQDSAELFPPFPDVILGSDCFYDEELFEKILFTIRHLFLGRNTQSTTQGDFRKFLCSYQVRSANICIDHLLDLWGLKCKTIPLSSFGADRYSIAGVDLPANHKILMLEITMK